MGGKQRSRELTHSTLGGVVVRDARGCRQQFVVVRIRALNYGIAGLFCRDFLLGDGRGDLSRRWWTDNAIFCLEAAAF